LERNFSLTLSLALPLNAKPVDFRFTQPDLISRADRHNALPGKIQLEKAYSYVKLSNKEFKESTPFHEGGNSIMEQDITVKIPRGWIKRGPGDVRQ